MNEPPVLSGDGRDPLADLDTRSEIRPPEDVSRLPDPKSGPYRLVRLLGRGGMGEVFLAHDEHLDRQVAVKRIRPDGGQSQAERRRFQREARAAARLSHSAIVHVYDLGSDPSGDDYLVLEYVAGETLAERLARGPLDPAFAVARAAEVAEGLAAAHEAGFLHRDLKAGNVMLTPDGHAKILDFGLVRPLDAAEISAELTHRGAIVGTCHAMSPEQAAGGELDARSDLFSLGSLLYEMVTGVTPFRGDHPLDTLRRVAEVTPRPLRELRPDLPAELERLVAELLAKRREDRPASAREVAARLTILAAQLGSTASGVAWVRPRSTKLRWRGLAVVTACLAGVALSTPYLLRPAPLRVAVAIDREASDAEDLELAASAAQSATISTLTTLEGVVPIHPRELEPVRQDRDTPLAPAEMARATAAGEVLLITVTRQSAARRVLLRRVAADGGILANQDFLVARGEGELRSLGDAVTLHCLKLYPDRRLRRGRGAKPQVSDADYADFAAIAARVEGGEAAEPDLARLRQIIDRSTDFLEPYLIAARIARFLFRNQGDPRYQEEALGLARKACERFPDDPRPLQELFRLEVERRRLPKAREILGTLEGLLPGDPELLPLRARLALEEGRLKDALALRLATVEYAPSWQNLYQLADLEARLNLLPAARRHFDEVLEQDRENAWALEKQAELEVYFGDLSQALRLYQQVAQKTGRYQAWINIGFVRYLQGDYRGAATAYRYALTLQKDYFVALIGLAEAEIELGQAGDANGLFRQALGQIEQQAALSGLRSDEVMFQAKCLAHLGRTREAVGLAQKVLQQNPNEPELLFDTAEVYVLVGDRERALRHARAAIEGGISPHMFAGSAWRPIAPDLDRLRPLKPGYRPQEAPPAYTSPADFPAGPPVGRG